MRPTLLAGALAALVPALAAQSPVPVFEEPHHRLMRSTSDLRVLDVNVPAGDTTLFHEHVHDLAMVRIGVVATRTQDLNQPWGPTRPAGTVGDALTTDYAGQPRTHRVENIGTTLYRLIAVENLRSSWSAGAPVSDLATAVAAESRAFRLYRVNLGETAEAAAHRHDVPVVIVLVSGEAINRVDGRQMPDRLDRPGQFLVVDANAAHLVRRPDAAARLVEIEVR